MTPELWIRSNFTIVHDDIINDDTISWGNGVYTPIIAFLTMFSAIIQVALDAKTDVRQAIRAADNGRGFAALI